jgi:hypothetical protein
MGHTWFHFAAAESVPFNHFGCRGPNSTLVSRLDSHAPLCFPHSSERTYARGFIPRGCSGPAFANVMFLSARRHGLLSVCSALCATNRRRDVADRYRHVRHCVSQIAAEMLRIATGVFGMGCYQALPTSSAPRGCRSVPTVHCIPFCRIVIPALLGCDTTPPFPSAAPAQALQSSSFPSDASPSIFILSVPSLSP